MALLNHWLLALVLFLPAASGAAVLWIRQPTAVRWTALAAALATVALVTLLLIPLKWRHPEPAAGENHAALARPATSRPSASSDWVGVDGLSFPFIALTSLIFVAACSASWKIESGVGTYFALLLFLETSVLGVFVSTHLAGLYLFLGVGLVPACWLIGAWGGPGRKQAARRFGLYMLGGLACLLICFLGLHRLQLSSGALNFGYLAPREIVGRHRVLFALAALGFLVRLPVVPLHGWMSGVLCEALPPVAMVVGVLVPLTGGYGLFRVVLPVFPEAAASAWRLLAGLGAATILYCALASLARNKPERFIAYASMVTAGFVLLGAAEMTPAGANGAVLLLLGQGLAGAMLILLAGASPQITGSDDLAREHGLGAAEPALTPFLVVAIVGELAAPGLLGQLMVLFGLFQLARPDSLLIVASGITPWVLAGIAGLGIILIGAGFARMMLALVSGPAPAPGSGRATLAGEELAALIPLAVVLMLLGAAATILCFVFSQPGLGAMLGRGG